MQIKSTWTFVLFAIVRSHVFVGKPEPFHWDSQVTKLIMPLNGDPNYQGPGWGQQPFPCKGYHRDVTHHEAHATWYTGSTVTFQYVSSYSNNSRK